MNERAVAMDAAKIARRAGEERRCQNAGARRSERRQDGRYVVVMLLRANAICYVAIRARRRRYARYSCLRVITSRHRVKSGIALFERVDGYTRCYTRVMRAIWNARPARFHHITHIMYTITVVACCYNRHARRRTIYAASARYAWSIINGITMSISINNNNHHHQS